MLDQGFVITYSCQSKGPYLIQIHLSYRRVWWLILALGVAVRFIGLDAQSFWVDEIFSAQIVEGPIHEVLDRIPPDKPPLDYYVQALFHRLGTSPEFSHRLPAALSGVFILLAIYGWAAWCFDRRTALIAFALAACNPFLIHYAQEARPYSLATAFMTWQMALFFLWWKSQLARPRRVAVEWGLWASVFLLSLLALYTLYATLLILALEMIFLVCMIFRGSPSLGGEDCHHSRCDRWRPDRGVPCFSGAGIDPGFPPVRSCAIDAAGR
jgi:4-amino-4-deoxy-L-arabinose transferase-like glycosyltransferase